MYKNVSNRQKKNPVVIFIVLLCSSILSCLVQTSLNTALTPIMNDLQIGTDTAQWLVSAYSLVMGIVTLATAFLIRRFPSRRLYLASMGIFSVGLLIAALSPNFIILLLARVLQAIGCGVLVSFTQVVILSIFPPEKRGSMMGIYGLAVCGAPVLAPTLAGIIVDRFGWHTLFWIFLVAAVIIFLLAIFLMDNVLETEILHFDLLSMILCSVGFAGILICSGNISTNLLNMQFLLPMAVGVICLLLFVLRQTKMEKPFLQLNLFHNREFRMAVIASMILYGVMMGASTIVPVYIQSMMGQSATTAGLVTMPGSIVSAVFSLIAGRLYDKIGIRKLYLMGSAIMLISSFCFCFLNAESSLIYVMIIFTFRSIGIGLLLMPSITWGMSTINSRYTSDGSALITSLRTIAGAFGSSVFVVIMTLVTGSSAGPELIPGMDVSYIVMTIFAAVLFLMAVLFIGRNQKEN